MFCRILLALFTLIGASRPAFADSAEEIEKALADANASYEKSLAEAKKVLVESMKAKIAAAQQLGDLKTIDKVQSELKAFEDSETLPNSVPVFNYETEKRKARYKMEDAYVSVIKRFTMIGKVEQAKTVQTDLDEFKKQFAPKAEPKVSVKPGFVLAKGTSFVGSITNDKTKAVYLYKLEIKKVTGTRFEAIITHAKPRIGFDPARVIGTFANGVITWQINNRGDFTSLAPPCWSYKGTIKDGLLEAKPTNTDAPYSVLLRLEVPEPKEEDKK